MHNRPKETQEQRARRKAAEEPKAQLLRDARINALQPNVETSTHTEQALLQVTQALVEVNPDAYTAFNKRRDLLLHQHDATTAVDIKAELDLVERALRRQPKAYAAWQHRRWIVHHAFTCAVCAAAEATPPADETALSELDLCTKLLRHDMRNMHCWAYRRFVCLMSDRSVSDELSWILQRIRDHLSNASAWHYRAELVKQSHCDECSHKAAYTCSIASHAGVSISAQTLLQELDLVNEAVFTDPTDQAPWMYHQALENMSQTDDADTAEALQNQIGTLQELLDLEPESKWPILILARLQLRLHGSNVYHTVATLYEKLKRIDPMRSGCYTDWQQRLLQ